MSATTYAWLVLAFPLAGFLVNAFGWRVLPRSHGRLDRHRRDRARVPQRDRGPGHAAGQACREPRADLDACGPTPRPAGSTSRSDILVDPLSVYMILIVSGVSTLIHLYSVAYLWLRPGLRTLLLVPQLLRLLDAAPGPGRQLRAADRRLGLRRLRLLRADQLLVPAQHGHQGRHEGVRDQRDRRRRPGVRGLLHLPRAGDLRLPRRLPRGPPALLDQPGSADRDLLYCSWSGRSRSRRSSRSTPGSRTRWRAPHPSPR